MSENKPLVIERTINAPIARVWKALTNIDDLKKWSPFLPDFRPEVGFVTRFKLGRDPEHQYLHLLEVTEVIEGKQLTYSWRYDGYIGDSRVTFELSPEGDKTRLRLTHEIIKPFPADNPDFAAENFKQGWAWTADALKEFAEISN
ncbi:MAG TPA: SRPBCC domain-containing protein [Verrucomicrobiae bacterium]|jgi:uncharacterized protein YndB with AHSA1/START domain|nr:SRPBCC domain-containing protein [Verrucomicrobiae bacterium]